MVNQFMTANFAAVQNIIGQQKRPFDSHCFIRAFSEQFQNEYVALLAFYNNQQPFQTVHQQIGKFLHAYQTQLGITANGKVRSSNIFGKENENEEWK